MSNTKLVEKIVNLRRMDRLFKRISLNCHKKASDSNCWLPAKIERERARTLIQLPRTSSDGKRRAGELQKAGERALSAAAH